MIQKWSVITLQKMQDFNENNEEKKIKEIQKKLIEQIFQEIANMSTM